MDLIAFVGQANQGAAPGNDVVIGVRRENHDAFRENGVGGAVDVAGAFFGGGFAAGPAGDGFLQGAKDVDVDFVGGLAGGGEVGQAVLVVVFVGEFEDGF